MNVHETESEDKKQHLADLTELIDCEIRFLM